MANTIEIIVNTDSASADSALQRTSQHITSVEKAAHNASSAVVGWISNMTSSMAGFLSAGLIERIASGIATIPAAMISTNAAVETTGKTFEVMFANAGKVAGRSMAETQAVVESTTKSARDGIVKANQDMSNAAEDHAHRLEQIGNSATSSGGNAERAIRDAQKTFDRAMQDIQESHADTMAKLQDDVGQNQADFNRSMQERARTFDRSMADLASSHNETMQRLQGDIADLNEKFVQAADARRRTYEDERATAADSFEAQRAAAAKKSTDLQKMIDEETAKGSGGDQELIASLQERLAQEKTLQGQTFSQYKASLAAKQEQEEAAARATEAKQRAALEQRITDENTQFDKRRARMTSDYNDQVAKAQETESRQVEALTKRIADEEKQFDKQKAKEAERLADSVARAQEANGAIGSSTAARIAEENRMYDRQVEENNQKRIKAAADYVKAMEDAAAKNAGFIDQSKAMLDNLTAAIGHPLVTAKEQGQALLDWIRVQARNVPFEIPALNDIGRRLMSARLDVTQWFQVVSDTAAGTQRPVEQIADAISRLASGDTGQALESFRAMGVNLRDVFNGADDFDAGGQLKLSAQEAIPRLREYLVTRFGGMSAEMMNTWQGLMSNLKIAWSEFERVLGKPVFEGARTALIDLMGWIDKNQVGIQTFATTVGTKLLGAFQDFVRLAKEAGQSVSNWLGKPENQARLAELGASLSRLGDALGLMGLSAGNAGNILGTFVGVTTAVANGLAGIITYVRDNEATMATLAVAVGVLIGVLTFPAGLLVAVGLVGAGIALMVDSAMRKWGELMTSTEGLRASIVLAFDPGNPTSIPAWINAAWAKVGTTTDVIWAGIKKTISGVMRSVVEGLAKMVNAGIDSLNALIERINSVISGINKSQPVQIGLIGKLDAWTPELPAFASGGAFTVGGGGGTDSQLVQFMATPGEHVAVTTPGQSGGDTFVFNIAGSIWGESELVDRMHALFLEKKRRNGGQEGLGLA